MWFVSSHNPTIRVLSGYGSVAAYVASSMSLQPYVDAPSVQR